MALITTNEAQGCNTSLGGQDVLSLGCAAQIIVNVINLALEFSAVVAVLFFLYGAFKFITAGGDDKAIKTGRDLMLYSVIGAGFIMLTFLIINVLTGTLGIPDLIGNFSLYQNVSSP